MKALSIVLLALFALLSLPAMAEEPIVIKFSHVNPAGSPKGMASEFFKKLAEARTNGRVVVQLYPSSQLYKDKEEIEALQLGSVQMLAPTLGKFGPLGVRQFEVFDLPFLFDDLKEVHRITEGAIGRQLMAMLEDKGFKGLAYWDNGFKNMNANKPLLKPSDFEGLKLRIFSSKVLDSQMRALGALPQVLAASEIYSGMQSGVVDGGENTLSTFNNFRFYEIQKHLTLSNHGYVGYGVIVNKSFWTALPEDIRNTLEAVMVETTKYANEVTETEERLALEAIKKTGKTQVHELTPAEKMAWKKILVGVHREQEPRIGKELIEAIYREIGFDLDKR